MNIGFIGLGSVVETAYLPALKALSLPVSSICGYDSNPLRVLPGVTTFKSLAALLGSPSTRCLLPPFRWRICRYLNKRCVR